MRTIFLLIDGYNLLFQSQLVGRGRGPGWLEKSRRRLLVTLVRSLTTPERATTTIVFDAAQFGEKLSDFLFDNSIDVRFANEYPEADDLLEELIRKNPHPKQLRVVSSDQRIRRCARARKAESIDSESFLEQMERAEAMLRHANQDGSNDVTPLKLEREIGGAYPSSNEATANEPNANEPSNGEAPLLTSDEVAFWLREFGESSSGKSPGREKRDS